MDPHQGDQMKNGQKMPENANLLNKMAQNVHFWSPYTHSHVACQMPIGDFGTDKRFYVSCKILESPMGKAGSHIGKLKCVCLSLPKRRLLLHQVTRCIPQHTATKVEKSRVKSRKVEFSRIFRGFWTNFRLWSQCAPAAVPAFGPFALYTKYFKQQHQHQI